MRCRLRPPMVCRGLDRSAHIPVDYYGIQTPRSVASEVTGWRIALSRTTTLYDRRLIGREHSCEPAIVET